MLSFLKSCTGEEKFRYIVKYTLLGPVHKFRFRLLWKLCLWKFSVLGHETLICRHCYCFTGINTCGHTGMSWGAITACLPPSSFPVGNSHVVFVLRRTVVLFPCGSAGRESTCNVGDLGWILELGRSPGEGKGYSFQYSGLKNSMNSIAHGIAKSRTRLSNFHLTSLHGSFPVGNTPSPAEMVAVVVMSYFWGTSLTNTAATL